MSVGITQGDHLQVGFPHELFRTRTRASGGRNRYAVSADGQRFLIEALTTQPQAITLVLNWSTALLAAGKGP